MAANTDRTIAERARDFANEVRVERFQWGVEDSNRDGWQDLVLDVKLSITIDPRVWLGKLLAAF